MRRLDQLVFDASAGVVRPRTGGTSNARAIAGALIALALLVGAIAYPIVTEMPHSRFSVSQGGATPGVRASPPVR